MFLKTATNKHIEKNVSIGWVVPPPSNSHHQEYRNITFLVGDPYNPSFATVPGRGDNPKYWS